MFDPRSDLAGVVLAAGLGTRLRPLTRILPKPLCPVGGRPLVDHAIERISGHCAGVAVNVHHGADLLVAALDPLIHRSHERGIALGTAGALGRLQTWIDGRAVLLTNSDAWFGSSIDLGGFADGWDGRRCRLLCVETGGPADFGTLRYCGVALLPAEAVATLRPEPSGLYEMLWGAAAIRGDLDLVVHDGVVVDCGTPADYLRANLIATGGESVTDGARIEDGARVQRSVLWPGSVVRSGEVLQDAIRAQHLTVLVR